MYQRLKVHRGNKHECQTYGDIHAKEIEVRWRMRQSRHFNSILQLKRYSDLCLLVDGWGAQYSENVAKYSSRRYYLGL